MNKWICVIICFFVGFLIYSLIKSYCNCKVVEGQGGQEVTDNNQDDYHYFYGYFGREESEDRGEYPGTVDMIPYYVLNNVNFADLKGELSFLKTEFMGANAGGIYGSKDYTNNTPPYKNGRKYGIQYIDKWLVKYKGGFADPGLGAFQSMQNGSVGPPLNVQLGDDSKNDIDDKNFIGGQPQSGSTPSGNKDGNWLSIFGECPNKTVDQKCKSTPACFNDIEEQQANCYHLERQIDLVNNLEDLKNNSNISAFYIGTIRLDDLNGSNVGTDCFNNLSKINPELFTVPTSRDKFKSDKDVPIWSNLIEPTVNISDSDAYTLLSNNKAWGCKMNQNKTYSWVTQPDINISISNICNTPPEFTKDTCNEPSPKPGPPTPPTPPPPTPPPPTPSTPPTPPTPPTPGVMCNPNTVPSQLCPGGVECPQCGKSSCRCHPSTVVDMKPDFGTAPCCLQRTSPPNLSINNFG